MPPRRSASLARRFPRRIDVPIMLLVSFGMLCAGVMLPAMETRTLFFWRDEYSIYMNILHLSRDGRDVAALILAIASIAYPSCKFLLLWYFWLMPFPDVWRARMIRTLRLLSRWAMVDVFAITSIVLASMTIGPLDATPKVGIYCYAGGILALMTVNLMMDRLARR